MKQYIKDNPPVLYYGIAIAFLFLAALISAACGVVTLVPATVNTTTHVTTIATAPSAEPTDAPLYGITQGDPLNIRACADTMCDVIGNYPLGSKVELQAGIIKGRGSCSGWWTTSKGFICSDFVEVVK